MIRIIKNRDGLDNMLSFLSNFKTKETIYTPILYDGVIESHLSKNNRVKCKPADDNFRTLWETLRDQPQVLSKFIEVYSNTDEETSNMLSEVLKIQKNKLPISYTLMSLTKRSSSNTLMGGELSNRQETFTSKYLKQLAEYKIPFELTTHKPKECFTFQDLTYLTTDEITKYSNMENSLFITNNKQHVYCFDGADCSMIDDYYLIWR